MEDKKYISGDFTIGVYDNGSYHNICITGTKACNIHVSKSKAIEVSKDLGISIIKQPRISFVDIDKDTTKK